MSVLRIPCPSCAAPAENACRRQDGGTCASRITAAALGALGLTDPGPVVVPKGKGSC